MDLRHSLSLVEGRDHVQVSKDRCGFFARVADSSAGTAIKLAAMPLEGHYERQNTPLYKLSSRELKAAFGALAVTMIAVIAIIVFTAGDSRPGPSQGCIRSTVAGKVGAETISGCGQEAVELCSRAAKFTGPRADTIVADCRAQGVKF
jgi:hypothetical protein